MHEISVSQSSIDIAEANARKQNCRCIQTIKIRLGEFTTIVPEALEFAFEIARRGTLAEDATLEIESVPMVTRCALGGSANDPVREIKSESRPAFSWNRAASCLQLYAQFGARICAYFPS